VLVAADLRTYAGNKRGKCRGRTRWKRRGMVSGVREAKVPSEARVPSEGHVIASGMARDAA